MYLVRTPLFTLSCHENPLRGRILEEADSLLIDSTFGYVYLRKDKSKQIDQVLDRRDQVMPQYCYLNCFIKKWQC